MESVEMPGYTSTGVLDTTFGISNSFMPIKAYQTVQIMVNSVMTFPVCIVTQ
jgi:hypothetical protein